MNAKSDNTTLFAETRNYMLKKIAELLAAGEKKLPTERELAEEVVASYATVRLVMKQLETEGFIRRIRGSGTYLEPEAEAPLRSLLERRMADAASFGNARGVRNLFEQILVRQAGRLAGQASVNREDLTRITAADVEAVGRANDLEAKER